MIIEVKKIPEGKSSYKENLSLSKDLSEAGGVEKSIPAELFLSRCGAEIRVVVEYQAEVTQECGRCLNNFSSSVKGKVSFLVQPHDSEELEDDDFDVYCYLSENDLIEYSQTLYDNIMLELPSTPLCDIGCEGIKVSSDIATVIVEEEDEQESDPRWAALKKLRN